MTYNPREVVDFAVITPSRIYLGSATINGHNHPIPFSLVGEIIRFGRSEQVVDALRNPNPNSIRLRRCILVELDVDVPSFGDKEIKRRLEEAIRGLEREVTKA